MNHLNSRVNEAKSLAISEPREQMHERGTSLSAVAKEFSQLQAYAKASRELNGWLAGTHAFALLSTAARAGILSSLEAPSTLAQIAAATRIDPFRLENFLLALEAFGIVRREHEQYQLAPDWSLLAAPTGVQCLTNVLRATAVKIQTVDASVEGGDVYTALPADDVLAIAQGLGASSLSSAAHVMTAGLGHAMPELSALWRNGARHLEVGCGVGNSLFGIATSYPLVTAVGLEIQPAIARETQRRANILGVADRVEVRPMDASDLKDEEAYDTAQWSQTFFPEPSRPSVLRALKRAIKPGGYVFMPLLPEFPPQAAARRRQMLGLALRALGSNLFLALAFLSDVLGDTPARRRAEERHAGLQRLLYSQWGVPVRTTSELECEVRAAGFQILRSMPMPAGQFSEARGLVLARKPAKIDNISELA